jgi:mannose-6-phosphate isomerase-like protein (cupin superfamily)
MGCKSKRSGNNRPGEDMIRIINLKHELDRRIYPKKWGYEIHIYNGEDYCGKILHFFEGKKFSMHYHLKKHETWYVASGSFDLRYIETDDATEQTTRLRVGDIVEIDQGSPHQLLALKEGEIFEVSTQHFDDDSYRIIKGDSQK